MNMVMQEHPLCSQITVEQVIFADTFILVDLRMRERKKKLTRLQIGYLQFNN